MLIGKLFKVIISVIKKTIPDALNTENNFDKWFKVENKLGHIFNINVWKDDDEIFHVVMYDVKIVNNRHKINVNSCFPIFRGDAKLFNVWLNYI